MQLDIRKILTILPHRHPMVMVDRVTELVSREMIRGYKNVTVTEPWCAGHFPGDPVLPGVLVLEALAQIGGILAYASEPFDVQSSVMYFLGIDRAKFRNPVRPGDRLDLEVRVLNQRANVWKLQGRATVDEVLCAEGQLLASIVERGR